MRNRVSDVCPACGVYIPSRKELPFLTRKAWRKEVAVRLSYKTDFIVNLGENTRIHRSHFAEIDVRNDKPIGTLLIY